MRREGPCSGAFVRGALRWLAIGSNAVRPNYQTRGSCPLRLSNSGGLLARHGQKANEFNRQVRPDELRFVGPGASQEGPQLLALRIRIIKTDESQLHWFGAWRPLEW